MYDGNPPKEEKREREREQVKFKIVKKVKCPGCSRVCLFYYFPNSFSFSVVAKFCFLKRKKQVSWDGGRREVHVPHGICDKVFFSFSFSFSFFTQTHQNLSMIYHFCFSKCGERRAERCLHCKYDLCHRCLFNGTKVWRNEFLSFCFFQEKIKEFFALLFFFFLICRMCRLLALVVPQKIGMEEFEPNKNEDTVIKIIVKSEGLTDVSVVIMICVENVCMIML